MPEGKPPLLPRAPILQQLAQQAGCEHKLKHGAAAHQLSGHREVTTQLLETLSCTFTQYQREHLYAKDISEQRNPYLGYFCMF